MKSSAALQNTSRSPATISPSSDSVYLNLLIAYPYIDTSVDVAIKNIDRARVLVDSGAFSAWRVGKNIDLDAYCDFLMNPPFEIWRYFVLDVIGDADRSMRNLEIMLKRGLKPIPIFTRGEDVSRLEYFYSVSDIVGIGGLVQTMGNAGFVKGIMPHVNGRKVHWLGFARPGYLRHYLPFSCDSSTWSAGVRYGEVCIPKEGGGSQKLRKRDFIDRPDFSILRMIRELGIDPRRFGREDQWINREGAALREMAFANGIATSVQCEVNNGTLYFNAVSGADQMYGFAAARDNITKEGYERMTR